MPVEGTSKLTRVQLAQLTVDFTKATPEIRMLVALIDPSTGAAAFMKQNGSVWGAETQAALRTFMDHLEHDVARIVLDGVDNTSASPARRAPEGIGEHLSGQDIPDM